MAEILRKSIRRGDKIAELISSYQQIYQFTFIWYGVRVRI